MKYSPSLLGSSSLVRNLVALALVACSCAWGQVGTTRIRTLIVQDHQDPTNLTTIVDNVISSQELILRSQNGTANINIESPNGNGNITIQAPNDVIPPWIFQLPPDNGDSGEVLTTDGSGGTTWEPGGSDPDCNFGVGIPSASAGACLHIRDAVNGSGVVEIVRIQYGGSIGDGGTLSFGNSANPTTATLTGVTSTGSTIDLVAATTLGSIFLDSNNRVEINLDTDNNSTTATFEIRTNTSTHGAGQLMLQVQEDGDIHMGGGGAQAGWLVPFNSTTSQVGASTQPFFNMFSRGLDLRNASNVAVIEAGTSLFSTAYGKMQFSDSGGTPRLNIEGQVGLNMIQMVDSSSNQIVTIGHSGGGGLIQVQQSGASVSISGGQLQITSGGDTVLLNESTTISNGLVLNASGFHPAGNNTANLGLATLRWATTFTDLITLGNNACDIATTSGAPAGGCTTCDMRIRVDGGVNTTLYVCEAGSWAAI